MNPSDDPRIAICMATFNPPGELFRRQIESIRGQTHRNWTCLVSDDDSQPDAFAMIGETVGDDPRFRLERNPRRLGVYRNFERVLGSVPADASMIALADQDDRWDPDKLDKLLRGLESGAALAYSDMRVTDPAGEVVSTTFWTARRNNPDDLGALVIANSITGGASMFRAELLDRILPFPSAEGLMHDHWIAMVAMALGEIAYIDRPLYDYVQHPDAALGHESVRRERNRNGAPGSFMQRGYDWVLGVRAAAEEVLQRGGESIRGRKRRALLRCARIDRSPVCWAWLALLMVRSAFTGTKTIGAERFLLAGLVWRAAGAPARLLRLSRSDR